jgi:hypothetical protein
VEEKIKEEKNEKKKDDGKDEDGDSGEDEEGDDADGHDDHDGHGHDDGAADGGGVARRSVVGVAVGVVAVWGRDVVVKVDVVMMLLVVPARLTRP